MPQPLGEQAVPQKDMKRSGISEAKNSWQLKARQKLTVLKPFLGCEEYVISQNMYSNSDTILKQNIMHVKGKGS